MMAPPVIDPSERISIELERAKRELDRLATLLDGDPQKDVKGVRRRLDTIENEVHALQESKRTQGDKIEDLTTEVNTLKTTVESNQKALKEHEKEHRDNLMLIRGMVVGLGLTGLTGAGTLAAVLKLLIGGG